MELVNNQIKVSLVLTSYPILLYMTLNVGGDTFYCIQIFMSDNIDKVIFEALLPVAPSLAPIFVAKKYV